MAIDAVNFGRAADFSLGIEDELLLVDPVTHQLAHVGVEVLERLAIAPGEGAAHPEAYAAMVELASPICRDAAEGAASIAALRQRLRDAGGTAIGAGLHPTATFGEVVHHPAERYRHIAAETRGLLRRTPTSAFHVHVGMPDAETAIRACNGLRTHLPLLQALAANSPYWHGRDSGLASARAQAFRGFPRSEIPPAFASFEEYAERVDAVTAAGEMPDYTFLWWDIRPHPVLGTVEVRAMDGQSALWGIAGLAALVHGLARRAAEQTGPWPVREVLMESSFRAARDGLDATIRHDGRMQPLRELARAALELARPHARELGSDDALEEVERILVEGNGAMRQRSAFERGGFPAVLALLVEETSAPVGLLGRGRAGTLSSSSQERPL